MKPLIILLSIIFSYLLNSSIASPQTVDALIQKICEVAREKLLIHTANPEERQKVLNSMKDKLKQQSDTLGLGTTAHIRLILQGVTILTIEDNYQKLCIDKHSNAQRRKMYRKMQEAEKDKIETVVKSGGNNISDVQTNNATKQSLNKTAELKTLTSKIESIINKTVNKDSTFAEKHKVANKLKDQFIAAFRRTYHNNTEKLDFYLEVVEQSVNQALDKLAKTHSRRSKSESSGIGEEALAEIPHSEMFKKMGTINKKTNTKERFANVSHSGSLFVTTTRTPLTTTNPFLGITKDYSCKDVLKDTCDSLNQLNKFTCEYDGTSLEMQQVCDGNIDCPDGSDEKNCIQQVIGKIHVATQLMAKVEMSQNCFKAIVDNNLLSKQGEVLSSLLNGQVDFLQKYTKNELHHPLKPKPGAKIRENEKRYHRTVNEVTYEVAMIVRAFAATLVSALCDNNEKIQKNIDDLIGANIDKEMEEAIYKANRAWLPSSCSCEKQYCFNVTNCDPQCKRYCYQIYSLQNFNCQSIKKSQNIIPLDLVCDGKLDCIDETDENDCPKDEHSISNSKSNEIFENIKDTVKARSLDKFVSVRVEMIELQLCVQNLQKRSILYKDEVEMLKHSRNKCFQKLADIYETKMEEVPNLSPPEKEHIYDILMLINENMISALKLAHFGNKNMISSDNCICRDTKCAQVNCPPRCGRVCAVRPLLTTYNCSKSPNVVSVPIDKICNGKINCPNAEDEIHCKSDICRTHHLRVIRNHIKMLNEKYRESSVGDALEKWSTKVTSDLVVLENRERLTPQVFKRTVYQILDDLSLIVGTLEQTRRQEQHDTRLKVFTKLSQEIMEMVKECNQ